jgi:hypothetical protein
MAKGSLFVGWGSIIAGREKAAAQVLGQALQYLEGLKVDGTVEVVEVVLLEPHGGELEGFVLIRGDRDKIAQLRVQQHFVEVIVGVQLVHTKVGVVGATTGQQVPELLSLWERQEDKLLHT